MLSTKTDCVFTSAFSLFVLHLQACFKNFFKQIEFQCLSKSILTVRMSDFDENFFRPNLPLYFVEIVEFKNIILIIELIARI